MLSSSSSPQSSRRTEKAASVRQSSVPPVSLENFHIFNHLNEIKISSDLIIIIIIIVTVQSEFLFSLTSSVHSQTSPAPLFSFHLILSPLHFPRVASLIYLAPAERTTGWTNTSLSLAVRQTKFVYPVYHPNRLRRLWYKRRRRRRARLLHEILSAFLTHIDWGVTQGRRDTMTFCTKRIDLKSSSLYLSMPPPLINDTSGGREGSRAALRRLRREMMTAFGFWLKVGPSVRP